MKHVIKRPTDTTVALTVTLDAADLAPVRAQALERLAKDANVSGFRPGKVPADVAAKHLDPNRINQAVLEEAVNSSAIRALEAEKITPLDRPKVDVTKFVPGSELEYTAEMEVIPEVKLGDYKTLKATKEKVAVTGKEVDDVIERLQASMAAKNDVQRPAKEGDEVVLDFEGTDKDGKAVAGASGTDYPLQLGSNTFIPGFEEGLVGKKAGDTFDLPLTFPKDYHQASLAGATITFKVTVKAVKEVAKPKIDDALAAKAGPFKTLAELKEDVQRELTSQKEREAVEKVKDSLIGQLVKGSHIPAPEVLVADQVEALERDFVQNLLYRGMTLDQYLAQEGKSKEEWRAQDLQTQAVRRVQVGLALAELSKLEDIQVSKEELEQRLQAMLQQYGNSPEVTKQIDTPEARRDIANRLLTEKTVDRLVELNQK